MSKEVWVVFIFFPVVFSLVQQRPNPLLIGGDVKDTFQLIRLIAVTGGKSAASKPGTSCFIWL